MATPSSNKQRKVIADLSAEDTNLLQEIDDTLRAERMAQIWKDFGGLIVAASAAVLLATVGWVIWKNHVEAENTDSTSQIIQARELEKQGKYSDAAEQYARIAQDNKNKRALVLIYESDAWTKAGQPEKAAGALKSAIAADGSNAEGARALASLKLGMVEAGKNEFKTLDAAAATDQAFSFTARELKAMKLLEAGKQKEATDALVALSLDPQTPYTMKRRIERVLATLPADPANSAAAPAPASHP